MNIKQLAARYGVHRNTASEWVRDVDLTDFFALRNLTLQADVAKDRLDLDYETKKSLFYELLIRAYGLDNVKEITKKYGEPKHFNQPL